MHKKEYLQRLKQAMSRCTFLVTIRPMA